MLYNTSISSLSIVQHRQTWLACLPGAGDHPGAGHALCLAGEPRGLRAGPGLAPRPAQPQPRPHAAAHPKAARGPPTHAQAAAQVGVEADVAEGAASVGGDVQLPRLPLLLLGLVLGLPPAAAAERVDEAAHAVVAHGLVHGGAGLGGHLGALLAGDRGALKPEGKINIQR